MGTPRDSSEASLIDGPERESLSQFLGNIGKSESTLEGKIQSLQRFYEDPMLELQKILGDDITRMQPSAKISVLISYLVFYKTLTKIVGNFNAASAGFTFEPFLAVLIDGQQIPASGANTIADFYFDGAGEREYISLKLYAEGSVEAGGSWNDLINDITAADKNYKMTYLVVMKNLKKR